MCGLSLGAHAHVSAETVIRHVVIPDQSGGSFVAFKIQGDANSYTGVSLLITDPDVLATIAETAHAARGELIAAKTAARIARTAQ